MLAAADTSRMLFRGRMDPSTNKAPSAQAREIGQALKLLRERKGLTQDQAAERRGVTRTAWQNYESGRAVVLRMDMQDGLALAVGATRAELLDCLREVQRRAGSPTPNGGMEEMGVVFSGPGRRVFNIPLDEGDVIISYPANLSAASFAELEEHIALFLRRGRS